MPTLGRGPCKLWFEHKKDVLQLDVCADVLVEMLSSREAST